MRKINKIINIALIFILIGVVACQDLYALRVPMKGTEYVKEALKKTGQDRGKMVMRSFIMHKLGGRMGSFVPTNITLNMEFRQFDKSYLLLPLEKILDDWRNWINGVKEMPLSDLDIEELLGTIISRINSSVPVIEDNIIEIENLAEEGEFKDKTDSVEKSLVLIRESTKALWDFRNMLSSLIGILDTNDLTKIASLYGKAEYLCHIECEENLIFDKVLDKEALIIIGVIDNFHKNAYRAMGYEGITNMKFAREGSYVKINVIDDGRGIPIKDLPKIFDEGFTTDKIRKGGLGLYLTLEYLKLRGGKIQVDTMTQSGIPRRLIFDNKLKKITILKGSEILDDSNKRKKRGTTFTMILPLAPEQINHIGILRRIAASLFKHI